MADAKISLMFRIYRGDELVREEVLTGEVIKVGKLASSHLQLTDESVSRMHAVIETAGPDDVSLIDLGSTRGTTVNGERVSKTRLRSGDEIMFGDARVVVVFAPVESQLTKTTATPPPTVEVSAAMRMPEQSLRQSPPPVPAAQHWSLVVDPDMADGSQAVEVQAAFRGVMTRARVLSAADAVAGRRAPAARWLLLSGVAATALALVVFIATAMDVGAEKEAYERWQASGGDAQRFDWKHRSGLGDALVFGGLLAGAALLALGLGRRGKANPNFVIGSDAGVDAPVDPRYVGASAHPLVAATPAGYVVNVTPEMKGEVYLDGQSYPLAALVAERGSSFSLPPAGQARLDCGDSTFTIRATSRPRTLDVPLVLWDRRFTSYLTASLATLTLFMIMIFSVPPDPRSLSLDMLALDHAFIAFRIKPPEEKKEDLTFLNHNDKDQGGTGKRHAGTEGRMGDKKAKKPTGLYAIVGPKDNQNPQLAKQLAVDAAKTAGLLGVLKAVEGSHIASIFGTDRALGSDAENVLGGLIGNEIANAYGLDGLGVTGTGSGGGGTGEGTIGTGRLGTMGKGGGNGKGAGYGSGAGGLGRYRARAPEVTPGIASVRGSLDREIIRRIIRRHINEVKYCYEQELPKRPGLGGRIMVQFTISGTGQVISSVLQSSTMGNVRVESCTVQAVRRWDFPAPLGGGLVIVSYPFVLTPAGTGE